MTQKRPQTTDYAPYFAKYVMLVPDGDFLESLEAQLREDIAHARTLGLLSP